MQHSRGGIISFPGAESALELAATRNSSFLKHLVGRSSQGVLKRHKREARPGAKGVLKNKPSIARFESGAYDLVSDFLQLA